MRSLIYLVCLFFICAACNDQQIIPGADSTVSVDAQTDSAGTDGNTTKPDGAITQPDGQVVKPDGPVTKPDGGGKKCGPFSGGQCAKSQVCDIKSCNKGASGVCVPRPKGCNKIYKPVCGCDNKTYGNDCMRLMAGMALKHTGQCKTVKDGGVIKPDGPIIKLDGPASLQCGGPKGIYCPSKSQTCDIHGCGKGAWGICVPYPLKCPTIYQPVCGCNNKTYGNDCERVKAGIALKYTGPCKLVVKDSGVIKPDGPITFPCGGPKGIKCPSKSQTCDIHGCSKGAWGKCVPYKSMCPLLYAPVCGCDNKTYTNDCLRLKAGVALKHTGKCGTSVDSSVIKPDAGVSLKCGGLLGVKCPKNMACLITSCSKGATGSCVPHVLPCPSKKDPVCGCNKKSYFNLCYLLNAGVSMAKKGSC